MSKLFLKHTKTNKQYEVVNIDKERGVVILKGQFNQFEEPFNKARFKELGYTLVQEE